MDIVHANIDNNRYPYGHARLPSWKGKQSGNRDPLQNPKLFADNEIRSMESIIKPTNTFIVWAHFHQYRLDTDDTRRIRNVFHDLPVGFTIDHTESGHPNHLDVKRTSARLSNYVSHGEISEHKVSQCMSYKFIQQNIERFRIDTRHNKKYLTFIVLNLFEDARINLREGNPCKEMKKKLSNKESHLLFFFCCCRYKQLRSDAFYELFDYMDRKDLDACIETMLNWLTTEEGRRTVRNLKNQNYFKDYLEQLYYLVFCNIAYCNLENPDSESRPPVYYEF